MKLVPAPFPGVYEATTEPRTDARGKFARLFCASDLEAAHGGRSIVQINHSMTHDVGAIRGLHYQRPPAAEAKWIRCLEGRVWDVAVDLRRGSPTFLRWHAVTLSAEAMNAVFIPEGFAHGFQVLEPSSALLYLHTAPYTVGLEGAVRWDDPRVAIPWPLPPVALSDRDQSHPLLGPNFEGLET